MRMTRKNYRVSSTNCVLNYYDTESAAFEYMAELREHSPSIAASCVVERRCSEEPTEWNETMTREQRFSQACSHARASNIECFMFDGATFRFSRATSQYHFTNN